MKPKNAISKKVWLEHMAQTAGKQAPRTGATQAEHDAWVMVGREHLDAGCPTCTARLATRRWERTLKHPSLQTMERWSCDGVAKALDGCRVEPDGHCEHGFPSWILYLGYC